MPETTKTEAPAPPRRAPHAPVFAADVARTRAAGAGDRRMRHRRSPPPASGLCGSLRDARRGGGGVPRLRGIGLPRAARRDDPDRAEETAPDDRH